MFSGKAHPGLLPQFGKAQLAGRPRAGHPTSQVAWSAPHQRQPSTLLFKTPASTSRDCPYTAQLTLRVTALSTTLTIVLIRSQKALSGPVPHVCDGRQQASTEVTDAPVIAPGALNHNNQSTAQRFILPVRSLSDRVYLQQNIIIYALELSAAIYTLVGLEH